MRFDLRILSSETEIRNGTVKLNTADFVANSLTDDAPYVAVFLPGGHGAMLGLPGNSDLGELLRWAHGRGDIFTLAICHGPAALLAAAVDQQGKDFIYDGYRIAAFPDSVDKQTPMIGYMPGHMPWKYGERLQELGGNSIASKRTPKSSS